MKHPWAIDDLDSRHLWRIHGNVCFGGDSGGGSSGGGGSRNSGGFDPFSGINDSFESSHGSQSSISGSGGNGGGNSLSQSVDRFFGFEHNPDGSRKSWSENSRNPNNKNNSSGGGRSSTSQPALGYAANYSRGLTPAQADLQNIGNTRLENVGNWIARQFGFTERLPSNPNALKAEWTFDPTNSIAVDALGTMALGPMYGAGKFGFNLLRGDEVGAVAGLMDGVGVPFSRSISEYYADDYGDFLGDGILGPVDLAVGLGSDVTPYSVDTPDTPDATQFAGILGGTSQAPASPRYVNSGDNGTERLATADTPATSAPMQTAPILPVPETEEPINPWGPHMKTVNYNGYRDNIGAGMGQWNFDYNAMNNAFLNPLGAREYSLWA